jgi:hypothetical protein
MHGDLSWITEPQRDVFRGVPTRCSVSQSADCAYVLSFKDQAPPQTLKCFPCEGVRHFVEAEWELTCLEPQVFTMAKIRKRFSDSIRGREDRSRPLLWP